MFSTHGGKDYASVANPFSPVLLSTCVYGATTQSCIFMKVNILTMTTYQPASVYVTVYGKTRHMGFSMKIEFNVHVSLISSTLELAHLQV